MRFFIPTLLFLSTFLPTPLKAQIVPDNTIGTTLTPNIIINGVLSDKIEGGAQSGKNLFHSFSEFNINTGRGVYFTNPTDVTNIFTRVTGANSSIINGILGVEGNANLFLMNPNGIIFGSGANLDIKGSFVGTTANKINFADGIVFSSQGMIGTGSIITQSVPIGLGFGSNPGKIAVQGTGHNLQSESVFLPIDRSTMPTGLRVQPQNTLALIGGEITVNGGVLVAPSGHIELGAVGSSGTVQFQINSNQAPTFNYINTLDQDIKLSRQAIVDSSGGSVHLQGKQVSLNDSSLILIQNVGTQHAGKIKVDASESVVVGNIDPESKGITSNIWSQTQVSEAGANIFVSAPKVILQDGGRIMTDTYTSAAGGNITINAQQVRLEGISQINYNSSIFGTTYQSGKGGNVNISTENLLLREGGQIIVSTLGNGTGGDININARDIELSEYNFKYDDNNNISASSLGAAPAGNLILNTSRLRVLDGSLITGSTSANGKAGIVNINASESIIVSGFIDNSFPIPSTINSSANIPPAILQQFLGLPSKPSGDAGTVSINTPLLKIANGANIGVRNQGSGNGGTLIVNANNLQLNRGALKADTVSGEGGDIIVRTQNLQLRNTSQITTTAGGVGKGGDININAKTIVQLDDSDITANAVQGMGGEININSQDIFRSLDSDIKASSELGMNGIIKITTPDIKQENSLQKQTSEFISTETLFANSCIAGRNSSQGSFVVTGNGGLAKTPSNDYDLSYSVAPVRPLLTANLSKNPDAIQPVWKLGNKVQEATQLIKTSNGRLLLIPADVSITSTQNLTCN